MLIISTILPLILGSLICEVIYIHFRTNIKINKHGIIPLLLSYGYIMGMFVTTLIIQMWDAIGLEIEFTSISGILLILCFSLILFIPQTTWYNWHLPIFKLSNYSYIFTILLIWISFRLILLGTEIWLRSLYPWDAWFAWGQKTATWFQLHQLITFSAPAMWPGSATIPIFTAPAYSYPSTIPLIQLWTLLVIGEWNDALMNFQWLTCLIALGLGIYGQARQWGIQPLTALFGVYLLLSLPLLNVHVALAGYADIWLATGYSFTLIALLLWIQQRQIYQIWFSVFAAIFTINTKSEGLVWIATLIPVILIAIGYRPIIVLRLIAGIIVITGIIYLLSPFAVQLPILGQLIIKDNLIQLPHLPPLPLAHQEIIWPLIHHLFIMGNWNLLWFLITGILFIGIWHLRGNVALIAAYLAVMTGFTFLGFMFGFTEFGRWAENATIINRLLLHMVPGMIFICLILLCRITIHYPEGKHSPDTPCK